MNYIVSASTDIGIKKRTNQDSLSVKTINTARGKMAFAVICDGMGGLAKGEVASATVVKAFSDWLLNEFPLFSNGVLEDGFIKSQWENIIVTQNEKIMNYGKRNGVSLGTTVTVMLLTQERYYILNVGDTRAYEITNEYRQITEDQTVVAREIMLGNMTYEEAQLDPRRNVLLQCVGASNIVYPDMFFGDTKCNATYMLCSDGFRHEITPDEIFGCFQPYSLNDSDTMKRNSDYLIELNKQREEQDNISVILVRTF